MKLFSKRGLTIKQFQRRGFWYVMPWVIGFLLFNIIPILTSLCYSFTDLKLLNQPKFIGFDNFKFMFTQDETFYQSLKVTLYYTFVSVPVKVGFALIIALILTANIRGLTFYRLMFYLPSILGGSVVISIIWKFLFMQDGYINYLFSFIGIPAVNWLGPNMALNTIALLQVWQFGSSMVIFLAALKNVPQDLYEAAMVDGAKRISTFIHITIPLITPIIFFNLLMQMIQSLQHFTEAFVITNGGPLKATYLFGFKVWEDAFRFSKLGYASALSWILVLIIVALTIIIFKTSRFWVYDEGNNV